MGKRLLSVILAMAMVCMTLTPAFSARAEEITDVLEEVDDSELDDEADAEGGETFADVAAAEIEAADVDEEELKDGLWSTYYLADRADKSKEVKVAGIPHEEDINYPKNNSGRLTSLMNANAGTADYVAIEWTGYIKVEEDGYYNFHTFSDNGVRLYLDDELLIDHWVITWDDEGIESGPVYLSAGEYVPFTFEYLEWNGGEHLTLKWSKDGGAQEIVPISVFSYIEPEEEPKKEPIDADELKHSGLLGEYYTISTTDKGAEHSFLFDVLKSSYRDKGNIFYDDTGILLKARTDLEDWAGIRWTGYITVPETGEYTFWIFSDNGVKITLEGEQILTWWRNAWDVDVSSKKVYLEAGKAYEFKYDYFEATGGQHTHLYWENDQGLAKEPVPESAFYLPLDYAGPIVGDIDDSDAQRDITQGTSGTIKVLGDSLDADDTKAMFTTVSRVPLRKYQLDILQKSANEIVFAVPDNMDLGYDRIQVTANGISDVSEGVVRFYEPGRENRMEHPRPEWVRENWVNLNGIWDFTFDEAEAGADKDEWYQNFNQEFDMEINVPFSWESPYSGVVDTDYRGVAWYRRDLVIDSAMKEMETYVLRFGAVDAECWLWVNDQYVGSHIGGYTAFEFDITEFVDADGVNEIVLRVEDKASYGKDSYPALVGKQGHNAPCGYTHSSGIWQTVYLEGRQAATYLNYVQANVDLNSVQFDADITSDKDMTVSVEYNFTGKVYDAEKDEDILNGSVMSYTQDGVQIKAGVNTVSLDKVTIENPKLWNFDEANLYYGTIILRDSNNNIVDEVETYFGLRVVDTDYSQYDNGVAIKYIHVNGEPVYLSGLLDQGYWEEGIYTAPTEEALRFDVEAMKDLGFNMIRKHLKLEDPIQYYWADKLGMFIWQDMPHATAMVPNSAGEAPGRDIYEETLVTLMNEVVYNHPSVIAVMLFNETWGLQSAYDRNNLDNNNHAFYRKGYSNLLDDTINSHDWVRGLYHWCKDVNANLLIEDMSPCNHDHINETDLNTWHQYRRGYDEARFWILWELEDVTNPHDDNSNTPIAPGRNWFNNSRGESNGPSDQPFLNSEYGGVDAYAGDWDVSWCFKHMTDIQRQHMELSGYVYTEPYDVEYERNGILTYDRREKVFGYDGVAYGGDMYINDLTAPEYVGIDADPAMVISPGEYYKEKWGAMRWTPYDLSKNSYKVKWRFDATDEYGNNISTNIGGEFDIDFEPYIKYSDYIRFTAPNQNCVGTITIWIEENNMGVSRSIRKNFINVIVSDKENEATQEVFEDGSVVVTSPYYRLSEEDEEAKSIHGTGEISLDFTLPEDFNAADLNAMRLLVEASSVKGEGWFTPTTFNSAQAQTTVGNEVPSDLTVLVNGIEVDTVCLPDNPRDIRGTLSLTHGFYGGASAGNFGYLVNINVTDDTLNAIKATMQAGEEVTVTYKVKDDAENKGGLRLYGKEDGRFGVSPMLILNPAELYNEESVVVNASEKEIAALTDSNYSVEAAISADDQASFLVRYNGTDGYEVLADGNTLTLSKIGGKEIGSYEGLNDGENIIKITLFDDHIRVYVNNMPEPVIDEYDYSGYKGGVSVKAKGSAEFTNLVVSPESYSSSAKEPGEVQFVDNFVTNQNTFGSRYTIMGAENSFTPSAASGSANPNNLVVKAPAGDKLIVDGINAGDVILEADITITGDSHSDGRKNDPNIGFAFRSSEFRESIDGVYGYYAGIGYEYRTNHGEGNKRITNRGYIQVGRMSNNWTELACVPIEEITSDNETHRLRVVAIGSRIRVYLDDETEPRVDIYDETYKSGGVALRGFRAAATVDNLVIATAPRYNTDFDNNNISEWDVYSGNWKAENKELVSSQNGFMLIGDKNWSDYNMSADITLDEGTTAGIAVRAAVASGDKLNGYQALLDQATGKVQLIKSQGGVETILDETVAKEGGFAKGTYELAVKPINNTYRVYLDGKAVLTVSDNTFMQGRAGLVNAAGTVKVDNLDITDKFVYEENFADGSLAGWDIIEGNFSTSDETLSLAAGEGRKMTDGYVTWNDYVLSGRMNLSFHASQKSNAGFGFRGSDFAIGGDALRSYVAGINKNPANPTDATAGTGIEIGIQHHGWTSWNVARINNSDIVSDKWYDFEVRVEGNKVYTYLDGVLMQDGATNNLYEYGMFTIRNYRADLNMQYFSAIPVELFDVTKETKEQDLAELIAAAKALLNNEDYSQESRGQLAAAIEVAEELQDANTYIEVNRGYGNLKKAVDKLVEENKPVDKTDLQNYYNAVIAEDYQEEDYTADSYKVLDSALKQAEAILTKADASQGEVDAALKALQEAVKGLVEITNEKEALKRLIDLAETLKEEDYSEESWKLFSSQLNNAKTVYNGGGATTKDINHAYNMLYLAMALLDDGSGSGVSMGILEIFVAAAHKAVADGEVANAIPSVQAEFNEALTAAEKIIAEGTADGDQIMSAALALLSALHKLGFEAGDIRFLQELYTLCLSIDPNNYIQDAQWAEFEAAMAEAKDVLDDTEPLKAAITKAYDRLLAAAQEINPKGSGQISKDDLHAAILMAEDIKAVLEAKYVEAGQSIFLKALEDAWTVYNEAASTQEQIDEAYVNLVKAMAGLRYKADKSVLKDTVKMARAIDLSMYTQSSAQALTALLSEAEILLADENLSEEEQEKLDVLVIAILKAVDNLVKKADDPKADNKDTDGDGSGNADGGKGGKDGKNGAKTGDLNNIVMLIVLLGLSSIFAAAFITARKRKNMR